MSEHMVTPEQHFEEVVSWFRNPVKTRKGFKALCPAHDDHDPSLTIDPGVNHDVVICCRLGCDTADVLAAVGRSITDLFIPRIQPNPINRSAFNSPYRIVATYSYYDATGELAYEAVRREAEGRKKSFLLRRPDDSGGWINNVEGVERILYRLPQLRSEPEGWVSFGEGEKVADCLADLGMLSTCIAGGTQGTIPPRMIDELRSHAGVSIYPDNDEPGIAFAHKIARLLYDASILVKVVRL